MQVVGFVGNPVERIADTKIPHLFSDPAGCIAGRVLWCPLRCADGVSSLRCTRRPAGWYASTRGRSTAAARALWLELIPPEKDVLAECKCMGIQVGALARGGFAGMNAYVAEVRAEARFHMAADRGRQRRAARMFTCGDKAAEVGGVRRWGCLSTLKRTLGSPLLCRRPGCGRFLHARHFARGLFGFELACPSASRPGTAGERCCPLHHAFLRALLG